MSAASLRKAMASARTAGIGVGERAVAVLAHVDLGGHPDGLEPVLCQGLLDLLDGDSLGEGVGDVHHGQVADLARPGDLLERGTAGA